MKTTTIQDIAKRAKVSKSTVSRVLNGTTPVAKEKRQAVLEAAEALGFKPNVFARSLASGRSMTIGVVTQNLGSPFYDAISQGVIAGLEDSGYSPLFADGRWREDVERDAIRSLLGRRVDGLVFIGGQVSSAELKSMCGAIPRVVIGRRLPESQHCCFYVDNVEGGYLATQHLIEHGHQHIAHIKGLRHHPDAKDRLAGYRKALKEAEIPFRSKLVLDGDFSGNGGLAAIETLLDNSVSFTAIFAANDMTAMGARLALYRSGRSVPSDVSIVGYDDQAEATFTTPPLTTIHQPALQLGEQASRAVLDMIQGETIPSRAFHAELVKRDSVAQPGDER